MTNTNRKIKIRERMAETGEPYAEARRHVIEEARPRRQPSAEGDKVYVHYTYTRSGDLEFDAADWDNALTNERQRMVEEAFGEELDADFHVYGGQGIAECVDGGELTYIPTTQAEREAERDAEAIEYAIRAHAGIDEYGEWPEGVVRPNAGDSYVIEHEGVQYVVLRRQRSIVAVIDIADGDYNVLESWPKDIERR